MSRFAGQFARFVTGFSIFSMLVSGFAFVQAATVTSANDYPTTLQAGVDADHEIVFTTPSGAAEGETITLSFDAEFDTAGILEDDVDVEDDATDLTTAADCSGAEQASVAMSGDILTVTICAGDGGAIAGGSEVTIKIGTNATASGTGTNQIGNPPAEGSYFINLNGTFGDSGSFILPIGGDDRVSVTATVTGGGGGGGGGGPPPPPPPGDISGPIITNVTVSNLTGTSATISWDTNEPADGNVDYGTTVSYGSTQTEGAGFVTIHSVQLTGLTPGTTYHFRVRSRDISNNESATGDFTFTTPDDVAPVISNVQAVDITQTSARIVWNTNEPADSKVDYGTTASYGITVEDGAMVTSHSVLLTSLGSGVTYHFRVRSQDAFLNEAASGDFTFTTLQNPPPSNASNLTVTPGDGQNTLSWSNPPDADFAGTRIIFCTNEPPSSVDDPDCAVAFDGAGTSFTHVGLQNGTTYYYGVYAYDTAGQFSSGAIGSGTPTAPEEEPPTEEPPTEEPPPTQPPAEEPPGPEPGPPPSGPACGDGVCSEIESSEGLCPIDCAPEPPAAPTCGNAVCEERETSASCPDDCVPGLVPSGVLEGDLELFVASGALEIRPTSSGVWRVLSSTVVRVQLLARNLEKPVDRVQLAVGSETFLMAPNFEEGDGGADLRSAAIGDDAYVATFTVGQPANYASSVTVFYDDGTAQAVSFTIQAVGHGLVFTAREGAVQPIEGATVTLLEAGNGLTPWDGSPYGQFNPVTTADDGRFAWYAPNGTYVVRAEAADYASTERNVAVDDHIVNPSIQMAALLEPVPPVPEEEAPTVLLPPAVEEFIEDARELFRDVSEAVSEALDAIRDIPGVEETAEVALPVLAVAAAASGLVLLFSFNLLPFAQYLFTAPILFFARRRRRGFGVVYNAISKLPVDLAVVRLYELPADVNAQGPQKLIASRVTDRGGRYFFTAKPGRYALSAAKAGFVFPSETLREKREDGEYLDIYHGESIVVTEANAVIAANIPLDPSQAEQFHKPASIVWKSRLRVIQNAVALTGLLVAVVVAIILPSLFSVGMIFLQLLVYALARILARPRKPKSWGIVYDKSTGKPLVGAVARVLEPKYNKLLETAVTDQKGRYSFVLGPSQYIAVFEKPGYQRVEVRPIDYTQVKEPTEFGQKIPLPKQ